MLRAALLCLALVLGGCATPSYYAQAVSGHWGLMKQRVEIDALLQDPRTDRELAAELRLALSIRDFGIHELGLPDSDAYRQYVATGQNAVTWNVVAAPEFSVRPRRWCFLVSGCVPYRGYFSEADANRFADTLRNRGYDVSVTPATAYSTLGWFDDPLLDTMFRHGEASLAGTLFHEMAHQALYVKGDTAFNESFAGFVETVGVERWLQARGAARELVQWQKAEAASLQFTSFLQEQRRQLAALYTLPLEGPEMRQRKQAFFDALYAAYQQMVQKDWQGADYFRGWFDGELNNARLALVSSYHGGQCAFAGLYREAGENMRRFIDLASEKSRLSRSRRSEWLQQPCAVIASAGDL